MSKVEITQVDERDSHWEEHPRFRVYLHGSEATNTRGWTGAYDVTGADGNAAWDPDEPGGAAQERIRARRREPVGVPRSSRMPHAAPDPDGSPIRDASPITRSETPLD